MDIKTRIDKMTEAEAKAALVAIIDTIVELSPCLLEDGQVCPYRYGACDEVGENKKTCADIWLDEALKEAQK